MREYWSDTTGHVREPGRRPGLLPPGAAPAGEGGMYPGPAGGVPAGPTTGNKQRLLYVSGVLYNFCTVSL